MIEWNSKVNLDWAITLFLAKYTDNVAAVQGQLLNMSQHFPEMFITNYAWIHSDENLEVK